MFIVPPPRTSGIYKITCVSTGKFYIGSSQCIRTRWKQHRGDLRRGVHTNVHLQSAWNKHGADAFEFEIIEPVLFVEDLVVREQFWLDRLRPYKQGVGFNIGMFADASARGRTMSAETREKMSEMLRGKPVPWLNTPEVKARVKKALATRSPMPKEAIARRDATRIRNAAQRGYYHTPQARQKMSEKQFSSKKPAKHIVTTPSGEELLVQLSAFCREHGLNYKAMLRCIDQAHKQHKGYTVRRANLNLHADNLKPDHR